MSVGEQEQKLAAFLEELSALSRRHGVYLTANQSQVISVWQGMWEEHLLADDVRFVSAIDRYEEESVTERRLTEMRADG